MKKDFKLYLGQSEKEVNIDFDTLYCFNFPSKVWERASDGSFSFSSPEPDDGLIEVVAVKGMSKQYLNTIERGERNITQHLNTQMSGDI